MSLPLQRIWYAAAVLLILVTGCGGGGEGDDESEPVPDLQANDPVRDWTFSLYSSSATTGITRGVVPGADGSGSQTGGLLEKIVRFGPLAIDDQVLQTFTGPLPPDGQAKGEVFGTADGVTYGVFAEAPFGKLGGINQPGGPNPIGANASLLQRQSFVKRAANASLTFTLSDAQVCAYDYNLFPPTFGLDDAHTPIRSTVVFSVLAWTGQGAAKRSFFGVSGLAAVVGWRELYIRHVVDFGEESSTHLVWETANFDFTFDAFSNDFGNGTEGCVALNAGLIYTVDLSTIAIGEEFTLQSIAEADSINRRGGGGANDHQASGGYAYLRDPLSMGGTTLSFAGLEPTNRPDPLPPVQAPAPPAACLPGPGPDPAAGVIEFSAASYLTDESPGSLPVVTVTRTGGSRGAVSATFMTSDGTALGGIDYTPVARTVSFRDGDATPRVVVVPIVGDQIVESNKTLNLTLFQPGGCAALGAQTTALLTIEDDDRPPPSSLPTGFDTSFGNAGKATLERFGGDRSGMALQSDGKIVMVGGTFTDFVLARFNADGSIDRSFGIDGKVTTDMGSGLRQEEALAVAIQADGRIVVVGHAAIDGAPPAPDLPPTFAIARYNSDGSLDTGFGTGGKVSGSVNGIARAVAIQPDGKIVLAGEFELELSNGAFVSDFVVARFNPNGSLDLPFGTSGTGQVATDIGDAPNSGRNVVLQPTGAIVVSGTPQCGSSEPGCNHTDIVRYNANGTLDASFGNGGKLTLASVDVGQGLVRQPDGKLVLVGTIVQSAAPATSRFVLMRLDAAGNPDTGFGTAGTASTALSENAAAGGIALQADGKLVVAGTRAFSANPNFIVARYNSNGSLDTGFANAGTLSIDFFGFEDAGENVLVQPDGRIVVGGLARNNVDGYGLARINP